MYTYYIHIYHVNGDYVQSLKFTTSTTANRARNTLVARSDMKNFKLSSVTTSSAV